MIATSPTPHTLQLRKQPSSKSSCRSLIAATLSLAAASMFLSACGSGSTFEPLVPARFVSFGDALSDLGQTGNRFTVNDATTNIWVQQLAASYGRTITVSPGGLGFAADGARVEGVNSIATQITTFLAANVIATSDVLVIDAGYAELVALAGVNATEAPLLTAADLAGKALGAQVKRLTTAGAKHVVIANAPDLGKTPLATTLLRVASLTKASRAFNDGLKISLANVTDSVLLIDNEAYINTIYSNAATLLGSGANITAAACATPTTACTSSNLAPGVTASTYNLYLFADDRHPTPAAARLIGTNAYNKVKARW
jgi:outer membrane lipase/esterase